MKSEFALALNQVMSERNLPRDIITEVLESALVQSYRKNANVMNSQNVAAKVDVDSGDMRIFVEKEIVDSVMDDRTEVTLAEARRDKPEAEVGDVVLIDVTAKDFGRIAAQNAKQMIVQKLREAERDFQFSQFAEREGEIVNGIITSVTPTSLVVNLGRAEGILLRKEWIPGEKYEPQQRVRSYVTEVKRSLRGPQILLSRSNKNMLRRLLEIEVPEIQKGQVEIKAIAREPGSRSKVAVAALQPGIDPVGACVGQRGARIQLIVNELKNEKIDVIEWNADPTVFITKALSPAKVLSVHPLPQAEGKDTKAATVVVPDDQLSLAIGREGQNARLAARLTLWHIDIKSITEALNDALAKLDGNAEMIAWVGPDVEQSAPAGRELLLRQRAVPTPLSADDGLMVKRIIDAVYGFEAAARAAAAGAAAPALPANQGAEAATARREARQAALAAIPREAFAMPIATLELSPRVMEHIQRAGALSVGQLMEYRVRGDEGLLSIEGIGPKALTEIKLALDKVMGQFPAPAAPEIAPVVEAPPVAAVAGEPAAPVEAVAAPVAVDEPVDSRSAEQIFKDAMSEEAEKDDDAPGSHPAVSRAGKKKEKKKGKSGRERVLIFDEELGRMVPARPNRGDEEFDTA